MGFNQSQRTNIGTKSIAHVINMPDEENIDESNRSKSMTDDSSSN